MTALSLRNPIAVLMACIAVMVFALVVTPRMSIDTFPELTPPVLVVGTLAPGLGPKDVEKTITWRIEKYVSATPGVDHVESASRNNLSVVFVWLKWGTDLNSAQTLVQQQVAFAMSAVPKSLGVLPPFVLQYDPSNAPVVQVTVAGGGLSGPQLYDFALNNVEPVLEGIPGVASASLNGGRQRQINIVVDPTRSQARGLTSSDVAAAVAQSNALLPSGEMISDKFDANVYTNAVARRVEDIGDAQVKPGVLVRDVGRVEDSGSPETQAVSVNGKDAVYLNVLRVPGGNTIAIVDAVKAAVAGIQGLPPGVEVKAIFDQSTFVRTTATGLRKEILQALLLISLVILFFLQDVRSVLIAAVSIPISFAAILIVLYASGQTLNAFTLGGLTLAMGPLVDISVVVLESIHRRRHHHHGHGSPVATALEGARLVAAPALAAAITTVAVLLPIVLLFGLAKKLFAPLGLTVATAMFAGYLVSMAVTPVACRFFLKDQAPGPLALRLQKFIHQGIAERYATALRAVLPFRWWMIGACGVLVAASLVAASHLPSTFFPEIDESMERVYVRLAPGTSLADASRLINAMGEAIRAELPKGDVELVLTNIGSPNNARSAMNSPNAGPHMGFLRLQLVDPEHRKLSQREIADRIREILNRRFPGVDFLQWPGGLVASVFANGYIAPLAVELRGDRLEELEASAKAVAEVARTVPGIRDVWPTLQLDYPEVRVETDRQEAGLVGVTARQAAQTTLESTLGNINTPSVWVDGSNGQSYYVVTQYDPKAVADPNGLARMPVKVAANGTTVTLGAYGKISRSAGPVLVERNQLQRAAHVLMQTEGRDIGSAAQELEEKLAKDPRTRGLRVDFVGQVQLMRETFSGLGVAIGLAVMLVFMIMATQFKSMRLPLIMLFTIPCTVIGIVLALMAAGQGFSVTALMGILMVIGIAVSNGILLVDHAAMKMREGLEPLEAIIDAGRTRLVPILMTSLATIIGLFPTALGLEAGTEANRPLALAVVGGLASSTVLSLFLVPSIFMLIARKEVEHHEPLLESTPA